MQSEKTRRIKNLLSRRSKCLRGASEWRKMAGMVNTFPWERLACEHAEHRWLSAADRVEQKIIENLKG